MDLLERFAHGDVDAFETVFRQFQGEVRGWILRIVRDPAAAEDLTIETFWRIYRSRARFHPERSFGAWARRIASHVAFDYLRSMKREVSLVVDVPAPASEPADDYAVVRRAFAGLPPKLRDVAELALIEEKPYAEIGALLGISVAAVKSRQFRAVRLLRKRLMRLGVEP